MVYVDLCGVPVPAIVAAADSPIAREGFQVLFLLCSDECAKTVCLASALDQVLDDCQPQTGVANAVFNLRLLSEPRRCTSDTANVDPISVIH
jgi:hypothetical protein